MVLFSWVMNAHHIMMKNERDDQSPIPKQIQRINVDSMKMHTTYHLFQSWDISSIIASSILIFGNIHHITMKNAAAWQEAQIRINQIQRIDLDLKKSCHLLVRVLQLWAMSSSKLFILMTHHSYVLVSCKLTSPDFQTTASVPSSFSQTDGSLIE